MERLSDLAIILKTYPYQERDRIAVFLTEHHGRVTGLAKGGIHSRRFGGALDFLACSRMTWVQKPHAELARIEEAVSHHEFANLAHDFERVTCASFAAEFCLKLVEPHSPSREMFLILVNMLHQLDAGMPLLTAINAFLCKAFKALGYPPSLLRCVSCARGAHEILDAHPDHLHDRSPFFWLSEAGGILCEHCAQGRFKNGLEPETLLFFHKLTMTSFKDLATSSFEGTEFASAQLYRLLSDFLHHHIPGLPASGLKSWKLLNDALTPVLPDQPLSRSSAASLTAASRSSAIPANAGFGEL